MANLTTIEIVEGEAKQFSFTVKDDGGNLIDVSEAVCSLICKTSLGAEDSLFSKSDDDFDHTNGANGILKVTFTETDLDFSGYAYCILKIVISSGEDTDKYIFKLSVSEAP